MNGTSSTTTQKIQGRQGSHFSTFTEQLNNPKDEQVKGKYMLYHSHFTFQAHPIFVEMFIRITFYC